MKNNAIIRKPLLNVTLNNKIVTSVDVREIAFTPSHKTDPHKHPCPVIGFVVEGTAVLEVQGQSAQQLPAGSSFYEPTDTVIVGFDNASSQAPMKFVAHSLLNEKQELIKMLPEN